MQYVPKHDFVLIQFDEPITETKEGILLSSSSSEDPSTGMVLAVGPGRETPHGHVIVPTVQEGDYVRVNRYAAIEIDADERLYFIDYSNIYCTIEK